MKPLLSLLLALAPIICHGGQSPGQTPETVSLRFQYEVYTAESGALYRTPGFRTNYDNDVFALKVDSKGWVWVGTPSGLGIYDGKQWTQRTFKNNLPLGLRLLVGTTCGPSQIVEGPPGTIWLGNFGVWRFREGAYEMVSSEIRGFNDMAVDRDGNLWVVGRFQVFRYDGKNWELVLCPYPGKPASYEAPGFGRIAIEPSGIVWIGATAYRGMEPPWEHDGLVWIVDQKRKERADGPPMAPLFAFDGSRWRVFGPQNGLDAFRKENSERSPGGYSRGWAVPQVDFTGRLTVKTPNGYYRRDGESWETVEAADSFAGEKWILRMHGRFGDYGELFYRYGDRLIKVEPTNAQTGEVLDLKSEIFASLHLVEDRTRNCAWLGTWDGLYRIWAERDSK